MSVKYWWNDDWPNTASTLPAADPTLTVWVLNSCFVCDFDPLIRPFEPPQFSLCFFFLTQLQAQSVKILRDENVST